MTRATFNQAMLSPSRAAGHINRSTKLPLAADLMLPAVANECGFDSVSEFMREAALFYAAAKKAAHASALKAAMHLPAILCLGMVSWIYVSPILKGTFGGAVEMRRGRVVRTSKVRDLELEGA